MSSGLSRLPQELVDHIVDHLHDDVRALWTCATLCRAWLPASRVHLFSKVQFELSKSVDARCTRLLAVLDASPELIPHVHELHIASGIADYFLLPPDSDVAVFATKLLPQLLGRIIHVRRVELTSTTPSPMPWTALPPPIKHAFESIFHLPSLNYVRLAMWTFGSWNSLVAFFKHSPALRGLGLREIEFAVSDDAAATTDDLSQAPLEFLTLDYVDCKGFDEWLCGPLGISGVREFRLAHSADRCGVNLLHAFGSSLEHFHLKPGTSLYRPEPLSLAHCPNLRSLRLTVEDYPEIWSWVLDVISSIPLSGLLARVAIEFFIDPKSLNNWPALDEVLLRYESLTQVAVGVFAPQTHPEFQKVQEGMRGLRERGVLRVYQLALRSKSQRVCSGLTPTISRFEEC